MFCFKKSTQGNPRISPPTAQALTLPPTLLAWQNLPCNLALVHTVPSDPLYLRKFLRTPAEQIFKEWDVISTSLFHFRSDFVQRRREAFTHLTSPLDHHRITSTYHKWGFVLEVPPQNIIGAYECDIYFYNHLGTPNDLHYQSNLSALENNGLLSKNILGTLGHRRYNNRLTEKPGFNDLKTPRQVLDSQWDYRKNEILVMGRPDVQYHSMASKEIKVTGIVRFSDKYIAKDSDDFRIMTKLCEINNMKSKRLGFEDKNKYEI